MVRIDSILSPVAALGVLALAASFAQAQAPLPPPRPPEFRGTVSPAPAESAAPRPTTQAPPAAAPAPSAAAPGTPRPGQPPTTAAPAQPGGQPPTTGQAPASAQAPTSGQQPAGAQPPSSAQAPNTDMESGEGQAPRCLAYRDAFEAALTRFGRNGLSPEFIERSNAFVASNCTGERNVCPRSNEELRIANIIIMRAVGATGGTFMPFACPSQAK